MSILQSNGKPAAADREGSRNVMGIKNKAVDKLIERVVMAESRDDLVAATRALDRVLLWSHYMIPQWYFPFDRVASWDKFGRPAVLPSQDPDPIVDAWWFDDAKAKALTAPKSQ